MAWERIRTYPAGRRGSVAANVLFDVRKRYRASLTYPNRLTPSDRCGRRPVAGRCDRRPWPARWPRYRSRPRRRSPRRRGRGSRRPRPARSPGGRSRPRWRGIWSRVAPIPPPRPERSVEALLTWRGRRPAIRRPRGFRRAASSDHGYGVHGGKQGLPLGLLVNEVDVAGDLAVVGRPVGVEDAARSEESTAKSALHTA